MRALSLFFVVFVACSSDETSPSSNTPNDSGSTSSDATAGTDSGDDSGGGTDAGGDATTVTQSVGAAGGTVTHPSGVKIVIPAGALASDVTISISETAGGPATTGGTWIGKAFWLQPEGQTFTSPVAVTIPYQNALVP